MTTHVVPKVRLEVFDGQFAVSSLVLAKHFEKRHERVLHNIRVAQQQAPAELAKRAFIYEGHHDERTNRSRTMYYVTRIGFTFAASGFNKGLRNERLAIAYIEAFDKAEQEERQAVARGQPSHADRAKIAQLLISIELSAQGATSGALEQMARPLEMILAMSQAEQHLWLANPGDLQRVVWQLERIRALQAQMQQQHP